MNHRVIHRHRADHGGAFFTQFPAERLRVPVAGQVHDGFRPHVHRAHYLFHFHIVILAVAAHAQVHINFCFQHTADTVGIQAFVKGIRGNDNRSRCHPFPDKFRGTVFLCRHDFHLRSNDSFSRRFHLGKIFFCHFIFLSVKIQAASLWTLPALIFYQKLPPPPPWPPLPPLLLLSSSRFLALGTTVV